MEIPSDPQNGKVVLPTDAGMRDWLATTGQQPAESLSRLDGTAVLLHPDVIAPVLQLQAAASDNGFALTIASGYRGFDRQLAIWNGKAGGQRPVLDMYGKAMDTRLLSDDELLFAILRWSAIPGCSRHHWGSDMDVYDAAAVPSGYLVQLTMTEATGTGPFAPMHDWLDTYLAADGCDLFRPYAQDNGGIAPERWHLSHAPTAARYEKLLDETRLIDWLVTQDIALKSTIRKHWHTIFHRYISVAYTPEIPTA